MKRTVLFLTLMFSFISSAMAHEHGFAHIKGKNLELIYADHTISGAIAKLPVFAVPLEGEFGIQLTSRVQGKSLTSVLKKENGKLQGKINHLNAQGKSVASTFVFGKADPDANTITGKLDEDAFTVSIKSEGLDGHHYVNPEMTVTIKNKTYDFAVKDGLACMGCLTKISFVVLGMLRTTGNL